LPSKKTPAHSVWQKNCCSLSPTQFKPNLCAEIRQMLFAIRTICAPEKAYHPMHAKKQRLYVDEMNTW